MVATFLVRMRSCVGDETQLGYPDPREAKGGLRGQRRPADRSHQSRLLFFVGVLASRYPFRPGFQVRKSDKELLLGHGGIRGKWSLSVSDSHPGADEADQRTKETAVNKVEYRE
jgi:hypothetical protein